MSTRELLFQARYGDDELVPPQASSAVIEHLLGHRSVRAYLPDAVDDDSLRAIIAAAQAASSSSNLQAWSVVAVQDADKRAALAECAGGQAHVRNAPLQLVWLVDLARLERVALAQGLPAEALDYLEMFLVGVVDATLAAQNAVAAAESLGLATVYIGGMRNKPEDVARLLNLPPKVFAVFGMCMGYPDPTRPAAIKPRPPQEVVLHREGYSLSAQDEAIDRYDAIMTRFYTEQKMKVEGGWSPHSAGRIAGPQTLSGRDRLAEILRRMGFGLK